MKLLPFVSNLNSRTRHLERESHFSNIFILNYQHNYTRVTHKICLIRCGRGGGGGGGGVTNRVTS